MVLTTIPVHSIRAGDELVDPTGVPGWVAASDASTVGGVTAVDVRYADGGPGSRVWGDPDHMLTVIR